MRVMLCFKFDWKVWYWFWVLYNFVQMTLLPFHWLIPLSAGDNSGLFVSDFAESIRNEIINGNFTETDTAQDWQKCQRLQPDDYFLSAGYNDCMEEAIRFLIEDEEMGPEHPVVRNLKNHLEESKDQILDTVASNFHVNSSNPSDISYDCFMAVNLLDTASRWFFCYVCR